MNVLTYLFRQVSLYLEEAFVNAIITEHVNSFSNVYKCKSIRFQSDSYLAQRLVVMVVF